MDEAVETLNEAFPFILMLNLTENQLKFVIDSCTVVVPEPITPGEFVRLLIDRARSPVQ